MNEIVTFGQGYRLVNGIKVFVKSAKTFCNKLTVLSSNLSKDLIEFLHENNVNVVEVSELNKKYNVDNTLSPYTLKVIYFYLYAKHYCTSSNLYMCDFTDVYIQRDIFECIKQTDTTYVCSENKPISTCQTNTTWIKLCYNLDILNLLNDKEILNGGSILGNRLSVVATLKEMCVDMTHIISRIGNYPNIDQASLNKVVYFDKNRFNVLNKMEIFNLAHSSSALWASQDDNTIKINEVVPYVIHQYDVIKSLESFLYEKFN